MIANKRIFINKNTNSSSRTTVGSNIKQKNTNSNNEINNDDKYIEIKENSILEDVMYNLNINRFKSQINIFDKNKLLFKNYFKKRLSSNSNDYYRGMQLNRAPTLYINKKSISQIVNKKKKEKLNNYNNFYFNMKLNNVKFSRNKSKGPRFYCEEKSYLINNKNTSNISEIHGKSAYENFSIISNLKNNSLNNKSFNTNTSKSEKDEEENIKNIFPNIIKNMTQRKISNKIKEDKSSLKSNSQDNKSFINNNSVMMTLLPNVTNPKRNQLYNFENKSNKDINLSNFETKKIQTYIYELIYKKHIFPSQFISLEGHIIKIKYFQKIQEINLQKLLKTDKYNINNKIKYLEKILKIYNNLWGKYRKKIINYLIFLSNKSDILQVQLDKYIIEKREIKNQIEKLMILNVKKQVELEQLVKLRNFLLQVKLRYKKQPDYFKPLLHRDSRKIEVGNCILNSKVGTKNSDVINFLDSFTLSNLVQLYEVNPSDSTKLLLIKRRRYKRKTTNMNLYNSLPKLFKEKYVYKKNLLEDKNIYIPLKKEVFFNSPSEFIEIMENLEEKNLLLLNRIIEIRKSYEIYKQEYEKICSQNIEEENIDIKDKIKYLNKLKGKNKFLESERKSLQNIQFNIDYKYTEKYIKKKENSTFVDIIFFKTRNYFNTIKKHKFEGVMLFETLKKFILDFYSYKYDYDINRSYEIVGGILQFKKLFSLDKNSFNEDNKFKVNEHILKLLKIYNDIYQFVNNKNILYESNKENKKFIDIKNVEIQTMRKIENSRVIRQLLEEKRQKNIKKILDKSNAPSNKIKTKIDQRINFKFSKSWRNKSIEEKGKSQRNKYQNEFYDLTFY